MVPPAVGVGAAAAALALVAGAGWLVQRAYLDGRYVDTGLSEDALNEHFRDVRDAEVDVFGTNETYPFFGADLSNHVVDHSRQLYSFDPAPDDACRHWRSRLERGPRYVVLSPGGYLLRHFTAAERAAIFEDDPLTSVELRVDGRVVYRVAGTLDPGRCR